MNTGARETSLRFSVLASGSGGNCTALVLASDPQRVVLIDAGLSPRTTRERLRRHGLTFAQVSDILLTHLDSDHFHASWPVALHHNLAVRVHAHRAHVRELARRGMAHSRLGVLDDEREVDLGSLRCRSIGLPHDEGRTSAFLLVHGQVRIGIATDLGRVPAALLEAFADLDALLIESNYDRSMQLASPRPDFLKQRIMGGRGHLSNDEALEAILAIEPTCRCREGISRLQHIVLLHLSRQCNDPRLVRETFTSRAAHLLERLTLASQHEPTPLLTLEKRRHDTLAERRRPPEVLRETSHLANTLPLFS